LPGSAAGSDASGDLRLWEIDARSTLNEALQQPRGLAQPIGSEGDLTLLGYDLRPSGSADRSRRTGESIKRLRRLYRSLRAVDAAGDIVAQGDGLNVR
jgi:hypothetical protein